MSGLLYIIAFTSDMARMKKYYREGLGLEAAYETPFFLQFCGAPGGASLALVAVQPSQARGLELCFESEDIDSDVAVLRGRAVEFADEIRPQTFGKVIHLYDPERNLLSLLQPAGATTAPGRTGGRGIAGEEAASVGPETGAKPQSSTAVAETMAPVPTAVILHCHDLAAARNFYRECLGLSVDADSESQVQMDAGVTKLALYPRLHEASAESRAGSRVTICFVVGDLIAWADEARARGIHFTSVPADHGDGLFADAVDPEGNEITFREPAPEPTLEEQLAQEFEDDESPHQVAIRKSVKKGAKAVSRVAIRPEYKTGGAQARAVKGKPRPTGARKKSLARVVSPRGTGPAGSRQKPKRSSDPKRARNRPAVGRLKKAERRTLTRQKLAVARASKSKPVKHAAAGRGKR